MKKVLIADNDSVICSMLKRVLPGVSDGLETIIAGNGKEAVEIIKSHDISLVIAEIAMPGMDGIELLSDIRANYSHIPVFLMTAFGTAEIKGKIDAIGYEGYFEKPLNIEHLTKCIRKEINSEIEGKINGISLPSYLQVLEREKKTCTLLLSSAKKNGKLFFLNGELVHAETGMLKNEDAAYEIVSWDGTVIRIKAGCRRKKGAIKQSLKKILMEGLKKRRKSQISNNPVNAKKAVSPKAVAVKNTKKPLSKSRVAKQKPLKRGVPVTDRLKTILQNTGDIIEYAIFTDKGSLVERHSKSGDVLKCKASSYLQFSEHLNELVHGGILRYIVLTKEDNLHYIMFAYKKRRITVAVKPGFKTDKFLKKIAA